MFLRYHVFKRLGQNLFGNTQYVRQQLTTSSAAKVAQSDKADAEDIFLTLTTDYNRTRLVQSDLLSEAIKNINSSMSERLSLLLLNAAARSVHNVSSQKRIKLLEEAWSALKKNNVRLTSRHYETYLSGLNENGHIFDPDYYLKLIDSQQIQATPRIYSLLLTQFCREGNTDRAQNFLKMLKEKNISVDEDIFAALCVCQLKRGNDNGAQEIIQIMNERGLKSTISTYKEIFICLISEHRLEQFQSYYQQIEDQHERQSQSIANDENKELQQTNKHGSSSSVYLDAKFVLSLLNQCILYKERPIFDYLFEKLKRMNHANIPHNILNLSIQCLSNNWHKSAIELLQLQSDVEAPQDDLPYMPINDRIWVLFFKRVFETHEPKMIDLYMKLMMQKSLKPLDTILFAYYQTNASKNMDFRQAITFLLRGEELQHPMRTNYFYPLMLDSYYRNKDKWTDAERLELFSLIDRQQIPIEGTTYSYHIKEHFHSFYNNDFKHLLTTLNNNNLEYILNKLCRFLINDIQQSMKQLHVLEQVAPFFKLNIQARREEFARVIYQLLQTKPKLLPFESTSVESSPPSSAITTSDTTLSPIFSSINTICEQLSDNLTLKRDLYALLLQLATQDSRDDLCSLIANECIKNNVKFGGNVNEIDSMTRYTLPRDILEQLTRYKQGEKTWKQKLNSLNLETVTQEELEQIYAEAKQDGRHPLLIQEQLIDIYTARSHIHEAFAILNEVVSTKYVPSEKVLKQLFHLITNKMVSQSVQVKPKIYLDYLKLLCDLYERHFGIDHLTPNLTFRIAHTFMLANDEENALKIIKNKLSMSGMDNELFEHVIKFLKVDKSWLSTDALKSIGQHFLQYRVSDELTIFWNLYYDIMLEKSTTKDLVKLYSESVQHNSNLPYTYLFELFINKNDMEILQEIVDLATVQHGSQNVLHDLGLVLIKCEKLKQADKIFQTPWLKAKNGRIEVHVRKFMDQNNLSALINTIELTKNLSDIQQSHTYTTALRVAFRQNQYEIADNLIQQIEENNIPIYPKVKKYVDAYRKANGLSPLTIGEQQQLPSDVEENDDMSISESEHEKPLEMNARMVG